MIKNLKYPPIKYNLKKIPENLVYYSHKNVHYHDFIMGKTSKPYATCRMYCNPSSLIIENGKVPSVFVHLITSKPKKQGLGFKMLDVVKKFSEEQGCEGRFHLYADVTLSPNEVSHLFYRKYGMTTGDKKMDAKLDKFIKKGQKLTYKDVNSMLMYYPPFPTIKKEKLSLWEKFKSFCNLAKKYF